MAEPNELLTIEDLIIKTKIKPWVAAGLMAEKKWASGKMLTEAEFTAAVEAYLKTPMAGPSPTPKKGKKE